MTDTRQLNRVCLRRLVGVPLILCHRHNERALFKLGMLNLTGSAERLRALTKRHVSHADSEKIFILQGLLMFRFSLTYRV